MLIAAARTDHHRGAGVLVLRRTKDSERRLADIAHDLDGTDGRIRRPDGFLADRLGFAGRFVGPDIDNQRLLRRPRRGDARKVGQPGDREVAIRFTMRFLGVSRWGAGVETGSYRRHAAGSKGLKHVSP